MPREGPSRIARALFRDASVDAWELARESDFNTLPARLCRLSYADYCCLGFAPSVERLLSGFLLSDAPGSSFEVPLVPVDVPLAPECIEPFLLPWNNLKSIRR